MTFLNIITDVGQQQVEVFLIVILDGNARNVLCNRETTYKHVQILQNLRTFLESNYQVPFATAYESLATILFLKKLMRTKMILWTVVWTGQWLLLFGMPVVSPTLGFNCPKNPKCSEIRFPGSHNAQKETIDR